MNDAETIALVHDEIMEVLRKHDCCGAFTVQRGASFFVGAQLMASYSMLREVEGHVRMDEVDLKKLERAKLSERIASTMSMLKGLHDGEEKNTIMLATMHDSLRAHLSAYGITLHNLGPQGPVQ